MSSAARIVIVHRNRLFREALLHCLKREAGFEVVEEAADLVPLRPRLRDLCSSVFLVHLDLPERQGLVQAREITTACPDATLVMLDVPDLGSEVLAACEAGATGYILERASLKDLIAHVRGAAVGETHCSPRVARLVFSRLRDRARELQRLHTRGHPHLTRRELQIISLIDLQLSNKEIAIRLDIEVQTVKNHVHNILEKLELQGRHAAVEYARERGLLLPAGTQPGRSLPPRQPRATPH